MAILSSENKTTSQPQSTYVKGKNEKKSSFFDFLKIGIFELVLIVIFCIAILTTFNYFNLIPLYRPFPFLGFLPHQQINDQKEQSTDKSLSIESADDVRFFKLNYENLSDCDSSSEIDLASNVIVTCADPFEIANNGNENTYIGVPGSYVLNENMDLQINVALKIEMKNNESGSGIMIGPPENKIYLIYDSSSSSWGIRLESGEEQTDLQPIYETAPLKIQRSNFSITIPRDGNTVSLLLPNGLMKVYQLKTSFYSGDKTIPTQVIAAPGDKVTIYSLNYYLADS